MEGVYLNTMKAIYDKPTANFLVNDEKRKAFLLRTGARQGCTFSPLLLSIVLKVVTRTIKGGKKKEKASISEKKQNFLCLQDDMILYVENCKDFIKKSARINK